MSERFVRLSHLVSVLLLLNSRTLVAGRRDKLCRQLLGHGALRTALGITNKPANSQRRASGRSNLDRYLIVGAADSARSHFQHRLDIIKRLLKNLEAGLACFLAHRLNGIVEYSLGGRFLAPVHQSIDKLSHYGRAETLIGHSLFFNYSFSSRQSNLVLFPGPLDPIFRSTLFPVGNTSRIQGSPDDVITHTWQVLNPAAPNQDDGVFLEIVAFTRNV